MWLLYLLSTFHKYSYYKYMWKINIVEIMLHVTAHNMHTAGDETVVTNFAHTDITLRAYINPLPDLRILL